MQRLTDEQKAFLAAEGKIILCACPGSGKTFIVGKKLLKYLEAWPYTYRGAAILSFTNVASEEILNQTKKLAKTEFQNIGFPHFIGTLDSFINIFIFLRFGYLMNQDEKSRPKIIYEDFRKLNDAKLECHKKGCANNLSRFHWGENTLLRDGQPISCEVPPPKPCISYKKRMIKLGYATQREVPSLSLRLIKKYPQIAGEIAYRFPIIMVDEAQDTSREQMEVLEQLAENGVKTIALVGDPDQAIYEWRDATPEYFRQKLNDSQWNPLYLTTNFRSSQLICNATSMFSATLSKTQPAEAKGEFSNFNVKPILLQCSPHTTKEDVISWFKQLCQDKGINPERDSVAILTRGRIHSQSNIPGLWKTAETQLLALATYLWHHGSKKDAYIQCEKALFYIMIGNASRLSDEEMKQAVENIMEYIKWRKKVILILSLLPKASLTLKEWRNTLIEKFKELVQHDVISISDSRKISDIIKLKTRIKDGSYYSTKFLNRPLQIYFEKRTTNGTIFSSVHGVKGESLNATLLMVESITGKTITPSFLQTGRLDCELMRIAYVAMTRPRKLLVVSMPMQKTKGSLNRFPSKLWDYKEI